jgi:Mn-dependent DtxR family transcriptional regulator
MTTGESETQPGVGTFSPAVEDYLEQILRLINEKGYARAVDIAAALSISQASVTNMIKRLDVEGLLKHEKYRGMVLTETGEEIARSITERHQILTDFLSLFDLDDDLINRDVEGMEHHISAPTLKVIQELTKRLKTTPEHVDGINEALNQDL